MDAYAKQLARQNDGLYCEHCGSLSGHKVFCPLINRESAEAASFVAGNYSEADLKAAKEFRIQL